MPKHDPDRLFDQSLNAAFALAFAAATALATWAFAQMFGAGLNTGVQVLRGAEPPTVAPTMLHGADADPTTVRLPTDEPTRAAALVPVAR